jgi:deazaflavin-dependent oxidoreductase (nitroreductase family)
MPTRVNAALRGIFRLPIYLYRWHCGRLLGHRFLLLTHIGRRTGLRRQTVLEVMEYRKDGPELIVMSGFGHQAGWLRNISTTPGAEIIVGAQRFIAQHRVLAADEAIQVVAGYERRHRLTAPLIRAVLSSLLGWRYDGSDEARQRLVAQLPLIAFRPVP